MTQRTRREAVLALLEDRGWHETAEIESADVGGSQGTRRLRELRSQGYVIEKRKKEDSSQYEYQLVSHPDETDNTPPSEEWTEPCEPEE